MNVSALQSSESNLRRNLFIKYANSFMSNPEQGDTSAVEKSINQNPESDSVNKSKGIETLTEYSIFPKQVINGKTIITA